ncbi:hypothetical protein [Hymenobacter jeollabukensis]|uniref:Zinc-ribbon domain-containing protein n=1 Tax=Hymenobacter jeollabukensis TaxID=2025313 RepID=A0A5R8WP88_9BACT|nr:hypothetical protein [Hymenobacter jeollabukensis]TLM91690.1 hypothetical protein FDY95_14095 [Hymenobacter jeollabukensis]
MIFFGTNGSHVRTEPLPGVACPACHTANQLRVSIFSRYVHLYWIPVLPYSKPAVVQCQQCQATWEFGKIPAEADAVKQAVRARKAATRAPWWQWSGAVLLAMGIAWAAIFTIRKAQNSDAFLAAPRVGDIYTVRDDSTQNYSLLKVVRAQANTVGVVANAYETDDSHPLRKLNLPGNFSKEPFTLTQLDLRSMKNKGQLTDVDRIEE